jgi:ribosome-associated toxin RatA of RatAB toxin-antitoxin module
MAVVHKSVFLGYSAEQMFDLVAEGRRLSQVPALVRRRRGPSNGAKIRWWPASASTIHGVKQSFTTANQNTPSTQMKMNLVDGPFKCWMGTWTFKPLRADACKIDFDLHYEFSNIILEQLVGPVFGMIANSMVDSFCKRAETVYGG